METEIEKEFKKNQEKMIKELSGLKDKIDETLENIKKSKNGLELIKALATSPMFKVPGKKNED